MYIDYLLLPCLCSFYEINSKHILVAFKELCNVFLIYFKLSKLLSCIKTVIFKFHILFYLYLDIVDTRTSEHYEEEKDTNSSDRGRLLILAISDSQIDYLNKLHL